MAQAKVMVNTITGSDSDVEINKSVQLDNSNNGAESTYLWEILDQPSGSVDNLSSTSVKNPTITPTKEGSYLFKITVNGSLTGSGVAAVRQLKSRERIPAAGETIETDAFDGWAPAVDSFLKMADNIRADSGIIVGTLGENVSSLDVVRIEKADLIKAGLDGEERVPTFFKADGTTSILASGLLGVVEEAVHSTGSLTSGSLANVRVYGLLSQSLAAVTYGTPASIGEPIFLADDSTISLTAGTFRRQVGTATGVSSGEFFMVVDGTAPDWDLQVNSLTASSLLVNETANFVSLTASQGILSNRSINVLAGITASQGIEVSSDLNVVGSITGSSLLINEVATIASLTSSQGILSNGSIDTPASLTASQGILLDKDIIPVTNIVSNLGTSSKKFLSVYTNTLSAGSGKLTLASTLSAGSVATNFLLNTPSITRTGGKLLDISNNNVVQVGVDNEGSISTVGSMNLSASLTASQGIVVGDAANIALGSTNGTQLGTATTEKLGFWGTTPAVQPSAYTMSNVTTDRALDADLDAYGSLYLDGGSTTQTLNASAGTFDVMTGLTTAGPSQQTTLSTEPDTITVLKAGTYHVTFNCSWVGATNTVYTIKLYDSTAGTAHAGFTLVRKIGSSNDEGNAGFSGLITLAANDVVDIRISADASSAAFTPSNASLTVTSVGNGAETRDVLGTLVTDLQTVGLVG